MKRSPPSFETQTTIALPPADAAHSSDALPSKRVWTDLAPLWKDFWASPMRWPVIWFTVAIVGVLLMSMVGQVALNRWQGAFFRSVEKKDLGLIFLETKKFLVLVGILLALVVAQTWSHERLKIAFREWLTRKMLGLWLRPGEAYRSAMVSEDASNPDQRIQEDARNFTAISADLGIGFLQAGLFLISFIGVLWGLSSQIHFSFNGTVYEVPGYMVWVAIVYAMGGSWLAARVGRPMVALNERRYASEADFRYSLVRMNEHAERISFYSGEGEESRLIHQRFENVQGLMRSFSFAIGRLTWVTSGYGWMMIVLPVLVALPGYLAGSLDLGGLMMVVGAFNQVQNSLRWFVDNYGRIADWRAALHRVSAFWKGLETGDPAGSQRIQLEVSDHGPLIFDHLRVSLQNGDVLIDDATVTIQPGERVLLLGESGAGKSTLFRAAAGLWPWGEGRIVGPPSADIMFVPQKPYMPLGSLAQTLTYPRRVSAEDPARLEEVLRLVNLAELIPYLGRTERWDQLLSLGQQQLLMFARVLLRKPKWLFLDEATSALDERNQDSVLQILQRELPGVTVLTIAHRLGLAKYHHRVMHFARNEQGNVYLHGEVAGIATPVISPAALSASVASAVVPSAITSASGRSTVLEASSLANQA